MNSGTSEKTPLHEIARQLPHLPGVYRYFDANNTLLYVGKARDLKKRVVSYFQKTLLSPRIAMMVKKIARIETTITPTETDALILENNLIKTYQPRYNILFRDDKSYPYLKLSAHTFPRMAYYRGKVDQKNRYFGPFPHAGAVKESIQILQKVFLLRTCEDSVFTHRTRPCLLYQIQRCTAPCVGHISEKNYAQQVHHAEQFLHGKTADLLTTLQTQMQAKSEALQFEEATCLRDQITALSGVLQKQQMDVRASERGDIDILAVLVKDMQACVNLAMVRGGRHLGDRAYFPQTLPLPLAGTSTTWPVKHLEKDEGAHIQEILAAFLMQHYWDAFIPETILLNTQVSTTSHDIIHALSQHCGHPITLITRTQNKQQQQWLDMATLGTKIALEKYLSKKTSQHTGTQALIDTLGIKIKDPGELRIECFDISHTAGEATQAACVVFYQYAMQPSDYRRYPIKDITPGDDVAAIRQVLTRRYENVAQGHHKSTFPDIVLIDGGRAQVGVAYEVFVERGLNTHAIIGVAKGENRKVGRETLFFANHRSPKILGAYSPALMLIAKIRDEAHRFAITGMRRQRAKTRQSSHLEDITGVGVKRRQKLLARFGSLRGVANASVDTLASVQGISPALAQTIYGALHE